MALAGVPKLYLGGAVVAGVGGTTLVASSFGSPNKEKPKTLRMPATECTLHELVSSSSGTFKPMSKEDLKSKTVGKQGDYDAVMGKCRELAGKDIFIANKGNSGGKYYPEDQESQKLKTKFRDYLNRQG